MRLRKGLAARYWEAIILAMLGGQFRVGDEICGCVLSVRYQEDILSVWCARSVVQRLGVNEISLLVPTIVCIICYLPLTWLLLQFYVGSYPQTHPASGCQEPIC